MPPKYQTLLQLGPFEGLQASTSDVFTKDNDADSAPNCDPFRDVGALCTARGRTNIATLASGSGVITALVPAAITGILAGIYAAFSGGTVSLYIPAGSTTYTVTNGVAFTQAFQYGIPVFTNQGQQFRGNDGVAPFAAYAWQYDWRMLSVNGNYPVWGTTAGTGTNLTAQEYYYAFTLVVEFPDGSTQETSPNPSAFTPFFINYTLSAAGAIAITPGTLGTGAAWSGTFADGATWSTNIYRQSTAQPTFFFVANVTGAVTVVYNDDMSDTTIAANAQLDLYRDAPPTVVIYGDNASPISPNDPAGGVIFTYKERAWCFVLRQDSLTNNQPQCQLWFSDYGVPWSFNAAYQVLLVGNGDTALNPVYGGVGDTPVAAVPLASCAILHKAQGLYVLWGDDQTTFVARGIGEYGTVSGASAAACSLPGAELDCWLSPDGVYACDGFTAPQFIGEDIRLALEAIPRSDWKTSVGWFANRSYYLSFPSTGVTYVYHFQKQKWRQIPYGTGAAYSRPGIQPPFPANQIYNQILAARTTSIDAWDNAETDLGSPIVATWQGPLKDSSSPWGEKNYARIGLSNPIQASGVTATMTLTVYDTGSPSPFVTTFPATGSIDLSAATWHVFPVPQGSQKGYLASVAVTLTNKAGASAFAEIYNVVVGGTIEREWVLPV